MTLTARLLARLPIVGPKTIRLLNEVVALRAELASLQEASDSLDKKQAASDQKQMSLSNGISALRTDLDRLRDVSASLAEKQVASSKEASDLEIRVQALTSQISELTDRGAADYRVDTERSPKAQLMSNRYLERQIEVLRRHLASDTSAAVTAELKWPVTIQALDRSWWQRLAIPGTNCFTTSDHDRLSISDPGFSEHAWECAHTRGRMYFASYAEMGLLKANTPRPIPKDRPRDRLQQRLFLL